MRKLQAIDVISRAAIIYDQQLNQKNLLIIFGNPSKPEFIETQALQRNFLHLTGIELNKNIKDNTSEQFYQKAINHKINENDFEFKDITTEQKLNVLLQTLMVATNAKMIGDYNYNGNHINLQTDKLAGGVNSCMGFFKVNDYYVPNTVLAADIRKETNNRQKVLAILSKNIEDEKYTNIKMVGKKIDIGKLIEKVSQLVPIAIKNFQTQSPQNDFKKLNEIYANVFDNIKTENVSLPTSIENTADRVAVSQYIIEQLNSGEITEVQRKSLEKLRDSIREAEEPLFIARVEEMTEWAEKVQAKAAEERLAENEKNDKNNRER